MDPKLLAHHITVADFDSALQRYDDFARSVDENLDNFRYVELPDLAKERVLLGRQYIDSSELAQLMTWKLKHGTFRPRLLDLVRSNDSKDVEKTTTEAASWLDSKLHPDLSDLTRVQKAVEELAKLSGVGPATASLVLSVYNPIRMPFFSDEFFRWLQLETTASGLVKGWDRKINYTLKSYMDFYVKATHCRQRLCDDAGRDIPMVELEKVAYVLGKEPTRQAKNNSKPESKKSPSGAIKNPSKDKRTLPKSKESPESKVSPLESKSGSPESKKRKASSDEGVSRYNTRRSARVKTS